MTVTLVKDGSKMNSRNSFQQKHHFRTSFVLPVPILSGYCLCHLCNWHQFNAVALPDQTKVFQLIQNSDCCSYIPYLYYSCSNISVQAFDIHTDNYQKQAPTVTKT